MITLEAESNSAIQYYDIKAPVIYTSSHSSVHRWEKFSPPLMDVVEMRRLRLSDNWVLNGTLLGELFSYGDSVTIRI
ncbi:hypothetical protein TNIN_345341 [Trichonephila inaurata madagascariensis]|uniref:Uncharacterized protein n=1 Tax=Trichonephila inaurata madagascariensis TaxID=2747483 RepID=A0A8X6YN48_9ARAC|nr:hypothetical protein TNIN_345341 [Trichonephila inaurata madagascariensis]